MGIRELKKVAEEKGLCLGVGARLNVGGSVREQKPQLLDTVLACLGLVNKEAVTRMRRS